jgi:hypothetical protein
MRRPLAAGLVALAVQLVVVYAPRAPGEGGIPHLDKVVHFVIFAAPTVLLLLAGLRTALVVPLLALHGPVSEWAQADLLPHRDGGWDDATADLLGVAAGLLAVLVRRRIEGRRIIEVRRIEGRRIIEVRRIERPTFEGRAFGRRGAGEPGEQARVEAAGGAQE